LSPILKMSLSILCKHEVSVMEFKLIIKKLNNILTESEAKIFDEWYAKSPRHRAYFKRVAKEYNSKSSPELKTKEDWPKVLAKIERRKNRTVFFKYAALLTIFLSVASLWWVNKHNATNSTIKPTQVLTAVEEKIETGTNKAILTLEDGSKVSLHKGQKYATSYASSNGEQLVYTPSDKKQSKTPKSNILEIPRGGQFYIVLADSTKVWVNAETKLKYPVSFQPNEERRVELVYGEAYFEVSPSSKHNGSAFSVKTGNQAVNVIGTEFNIKAYKEEAFILTTLVEGKVNIDKGDETKKLTPGRQSQLNRVTNAINIEEVDVYNEISWKNGLFSFKNKPLKDIMVVLSRWYDFEVEFQRKDIEEIKFNGVFRRAEDITDILAIIKNTNEVDYEINQKRITMK